MRPAWLKDLDDAALNAAIKTGVDKDDIAQTVVEKLLRTGITMEEATRPQMYAYAKNAAIDMWRKYRSRVVPADPTTDTYGGDVLGRHAETLTTAIEDVELAITLEAHIMPHLERLTGAERSVAGLYYLEGLTSVEIGAELGLAVPKVRHIMAAVRKQLGAYAGDLAIYRAWAFPGAKRPPGQPQATAELLSVFS